MSIESFTFPFTKKVSNIFPMIIRIVYTLLSLIKLVVFVFLAGIESLLREGVFYLVDFYILCVPLYLILVVFALSYIFSIDQLHNASK